jgi:hypothetical protein
LESETPREEPTRQGNCSYNYYRRRVIPAPTYDDIQALASKFKVTKRKKRQDRVTNQKLLPQTGDSENIREKETDLQKIKGRFLLHAFIAKVFFSDRLA